LPGGEGGQFNGNIAAMRWRTARQTPQAYAFEYDKVNRLTKSYYTAGSNSEWSSNYTEQLSYDKNGNITALQRYRHLPDPIDNLIYTYHGNRLQQISDEGTPDGYPAGVTHYEYDANGNNTFEGTRTRVAYNEINLPQQVQLLGGRGIKNIYAADGRKLKTEAKQGSEYIKEGTKTYCGNVVFDINDELDYILFDEGRILYNVDDSTFNFEYHLRDHLGSVRVAFTPPLEGAGEAIVVQETSYYPFGAPIADLSWSPKSTNRYGYNGKEHIKEFDLGWVDYGARVYNPIIGRWSVIDPLANKYYNMTPYGYVSNNPLKFIDPDGKEKIIALNPNVQKNSHLINAANKYKDDGAIHIWAHGNQKSLTIYDGQKEIPIESTKDFEDFLSTNSKIWQNRTEDEDVTIILHACETGKETVEGTSFARDISKGLKNTTIIAPSDKVVVNNSNDTEMGSYSTRTINKDGESKVISDKKGKWNEFSEGEKTGSHPGNWKPKQQDDNFIWNMFSPIIDFFK
jgi:RHS repeat-associated protein